MGKNSLLDWHRLGNKNNTLDSFDMVFNIGILDIWERFLQCDWFNRIRISPGFEFDFFTDLPLKLETTIASLEFDVVKNVILFFLTIDAYRIAGELFDATKGFKIGPRTFRILHRSEFPLPKNTGSVLIFVSMCFLETRWSTRIYCTIFSFVHSFPDVCVETKKRNNQRHFFS